MRKDSDMKKIRTLFLLSLFVFLFAAVPAWTEAEAKESAGTASQKTGLVKLGSQKYVYYKKDGTKLRNSWKTIDGSRYYFKKNGYAAIGRKKINHVYYVFKKNGKLATKKNGGLVTVNGDTFYVDQKGRPATKTWLIVDGKLCYARGGGRLRKDSVYKGITFDKNGYAVENSASLLKIKVMQIVGSITNSSMSQSQKLQACWNYVISHGSYAGYYPRNFSTGYNGWYIDTAYTFLCKGYGNCYGFACGFAALAHEIGYSPVLMTGRVSGTRDGAADGLTRHCWVQINGLYYDPEAQYAGWYKGVYGLGTYSIAHTVSGQYKYTAA